MIAELLHPFLDFTDPSNEALVQLALYGDNDANRTTLRLTLGFIYETGRFGWDFGFSYILAASYIA